MMAVTFQVLEGIDKGRTFRDLPTPLTIGREEGNVLRLNDERVSRFHAKVQFDNEDIILTDLESTNGTRVNGTVVQIRRLRFGDRVAVGRSLLLFGSGEEIAARIAEMEKAGVQPFSSAVSVASSDVTNPQTVQMSTLAGQIDGNIDFDINVKQDVTVTRDALLIGKKPLPPLPQKMSPSQAARLAEILDFFHAGLTQATENIQAKEDGTQVTLYYGDWQKILTLHMLLARYLRAVSEPESQSS
ncbi:MAG: FHA domain-containing protein [Planctomycetes bacterium]|nr:FHA domain-containing protein [Planctomycetota bacterium]